MDADVRLYAFTSGLVTAKTYMFKLNQGFDEDVEVPVPFFLITHPQGHTLIDGGNTIGVAQDPEYWGSEISELYRAHMREDEHCVPQLAAIGIAPEDIAHVVHTHLHVDHCGALGYFPNARFIVTRRELEYAYVHEWFYDGQYNRQDFDRDVPWYPLEASDDGFDLYGDGSVRLIFTPGHTPGHLSVHVTLPSGASFVLAADACITRDHYENKALPGNLHSAADVVSSVRKLRQVAERTGATVVPGHDLDAWNTLKHAPEYYD